MVKPRALHAAPLFLLLVGAAAGAFDSDELLIQDDEEFEGLAASKLPPRRHADPAPATVASSDAKGVQFDLEHAFGDSAFTAAGTFSARLKSSPHGGQTLMKLRFSRKKLTDAEKEAFKGLLKEDGLYRVRVPSNVLDPTGKDYVLSSTRARCIPHESLDEHIVVHMDGVNILAINYGAVGGCPYPRQLKYPDKWSFNSYTVLKAGDQAPRTPSFVDQLIAASDGLGEIVKPPEKSFWAKYWMYVIPLGLIIMNAVTAAMNAPEQQQGGAPQGQQAAAQTQRAAGTTAVRRR